MIPPLTQQPEGYDWPWCATLALAWSFLFLTLPTWPSRLSLGLTMTAAIWLGSRGE